MINTDCYTSATTLARSIREGEVSPVDIIDTYLERIEQRNPETNAFVTVLEDHARNRAREAEKAVKNGSDLGPLHGVPVAIKDLCPVADVRLTFGSKPFKDNVAENDAILVKRLRDAGAIVLGKTNTPEFGHKGTTDNRLHGATSTPFNPDRNAGGSSGGSAAAVADGLVPLAQGGDGGGSIRIPASLCGVFGFKPSFRRVPHKARPDAFLEHTPFINRGPITRTVEDAALAMDVMAGPHPADPFSLPERKMSYRSAVDNSIKDLEIAYSRDLGLFPVESTVLNVVEDAIEAVRSIGSSVEAADPDIPHDRSAVFEAWKTAYEVFNASLVDGLASETSVDYMRSHREEASEAFVDLAEEGRNYSALEYKRIERIRTDIYDAFRNLFNRYDLLMTPTLSVPAISNGSSDTIGPKTVAGEAVDPLIGWALTYPFNLSGHPVASVPAGFHNESTPIGLQIIGPRHADDYVLAASAALEQERPWHHAYPPQT